MNLLNKELIGIAVLIVVLYGIQQCLPKKRKEGFSDATQSAIVGVVITLLLLVAIGVAYTSYQIKYY